MLPSSRPCRGPSAGRALGALTVLLCAGWLPACKADRSPAWAFDPLWVEPVGDGIHGVHTWQLFTDKWQKKRKKRHYVCSVLVEIRGEPADPCEGCELSWAVQTELLESDCDPDLAQDPLFTSLERVGLGPLTTDPEAPYPNLTSTGFTDYGFGWESHGWAYPDDLDADRLPGSATWDGEQTFTFWPTLDWPVPSGDADPPDPAR